MLFRSDIMNKKKIICVTLIIITIVTILGVGRHINASNDNDILTKKSAFDIIDNIEEIVIACLSKDGNKHLSLKNKYDVISMYIVKNNIEDVIKQEAVSKDETVNIGKIETDKFAKKLEDIFIINDDEIKQYIDYEQKYIDLYLEPFFYSYFDKKNVISANMDDNECKIIVKYSRKLDDVNNRVYIKYIFDSNLKIKDIIILSSILNVGD